MGAGEIGSNVPLGLAEGDAELARRALDVLEANWLGHGTSPSPNLYPHQWSWDSACIAMGYSRFDQDRAEGELRSLFAGQWRNGLLPHIVFTDGARYFPGPEFWEAERSPEAPARPRTSGIVQPPLHATAALHVYRHAVDRSQAEKFLADLVPRLVAWHEYVYRERVRGDDGLAEVWHPWESGMDNSPLWDDPLARMPLSPADIPDYQRVDVAIADPAERPTNEDYDRYAYLVRLFRELDYRPDRIRDSSPFAVQPVLFNSLLVQANRDLAELARIVGAEPGRMEEWAELTGNGLEKLWDEDLAIYVDFDVRNGERLHTWTGAGLAPLYAGVPGPERAERMVERLKESRASVDGKGWVVPSLSPDDPRFEPSLYWRGPVWPILNWVLYRGLARYGYTALAAELRGSLLELPRRGGFWEHYDPLTGRGQGGEQFAWTAALVLDLIAQPSDSGPDETD